MDKTGKSLGRILGRCQEQLMEGSKQGQRAQASITRLEDIICAIGELGPQDPVAELDVGNRYSPGKLQVKALICDLQLLNIGAIDNTQECRLDRPVGHGTHIECRTVIGAGCGETSRVGSSTASANPSCDSQEKPLTPSQSASGHLKKVQISRRRRRRGRDRDNQPPQRQTKPRLGLLNAGFFFGCPFYFHDPEEHQDCLNHELKRIADVRQHIWRFHVQPSHCPLCGIVFHTDINYAQRDAHLLQQICEVTSDVTRCPGATSDQLASMGDRAAYRYCSTAEERWYVIWDIMFPGIARPRSPYVNIRSERNSIEVNAAIAHYRQGGGLQDFARQFNVGSELDVRGVLNLFLEHFRDYNRTTFASAADPGDVHTGQTFPSLDPNSHLNTNANDEFGSFNNSYSRDGYSHDGDLDDI